MGEWLFKKGHIPHNAVTWTEEMEQWAIGHYSSMTLKEMSVEMSKLFFPLTITCIHNKIKKMGLKKINRLYKRHLFTDEQLEYIRHKYIDENLTIRDVVKAFSKEYTEVGFDVIRVITHDMGITKAPNKNYHRRTNRYPIGTLSRCGEYGEKLCIKINDFVGSKKSKHDVYSKNWMPYDQYVWEKERGEKCDSDHMILHLDGNQDNSDIKNLMMIDKKIYNKYKNNHLNTNDIELSKAGILAVQLFYAIQDAKGNT